MPRLFVALPLPADIRESVAVAVAPAHALGGSIGWTRPATWHVTLRFVGDVDDAAVPALVAALGPAVAAFSPVDVTVGGGGAFPSLRAPRVLWVGVQGDLEPLAAAVDAAVLASLGLLPEGRAWRAHLTMGRVRGGSASREAHLLAGLGALGACVCEEAVLFRSELHREGAIHEAVARFGLGG